MASNRMQSFGIGHTACTSTRTCLASERGFLCQLSLLSERERMRAQTRSASDLVGPAEDNRRVPLWVQP
eukprot:1187677-Prorocentrum_minimum.AAC.2